MMSSETVLRQILLVTDGCSNVGSDPVRAAKTGLSRGISTSVIGIIDDGSLGEQGKREAYEIAEAGGGMCRIISVADLSMTMQMVTRQTMQLTLQQVVNEELRNLIGKKTDELAPDVRTKVATMVDTMAEESELHMALVIDVSASMASKMASVREAVRDMEFGLKARTGRCHLYVFTYPSAYGASTDEHVLQDTSGSIADIIMHIRPAGNTPTGPALLKAIDRILTSGNRGEQDAGVHMRDYVV